MVLGIGSPLSKIRFRVRSFGYRVGNMKINISAILFLVAWPGLLVAGAKLKGAYPTTIGEMSVLWVTKEARLFEKNGLNVELIYIAGRSTMLHAILAKEIHISDISIP